jgi:hypothetical protein
LCKDLLTDVTELDGSVKMVRRALNQEK